MQISTLKNELWEMVQRARMGATAGNGENNNSMQEFWTYLQVYASVRVTASSHVHLSGLTCHKPSHTRSIRTCTYARFLHTYVEDVCAAAHQGLERTNIPAKGDAVQS